MIKSSFTYAFYACAALAWRESGLRRFFAAFARVWRESAVGAGIRRYFARPSYTEGSAVLNAAASLIYAFGRALEPLRRAYINSYIYRFFTELLEIYKLDGYRLFLYIVPLFTVLDYFIRLKSAAIGTLWTHALLVFLLALCLNKWLLAEKRRDMKFAPVTLPILLYVLANAACMFANTFEFGIVVQGFRANVEYIFFFFAVFYLLDTEKQAEWMLKIFAVAVFFIALYGIYQYLVKVPMPPNWIDSTEDISTRAFSIAQNPNTLGGLLTLAIPVTLSLFTEERRRLTKLYYLIFVLADLLALMLTFSRGAWMGFGLAAVIYVMFKDKRLIIPLALAAAAVFLLAPAVRERILYMLSPEYTQSSLAGGRLMRWGAGWDMFMSNGPFGMGLGHFGGAVAANNNVKNSFYMDNYYLKIAVETGLVGVIPLLYMVWKLIVHTLRATLACADKHAKELMLGCFCGIAGVLAHNIGENLFEVPLMAISFYMLAAITLHLGIVTK